jgi:hypothetical protein
MNFDALSILMFRVQNDPRFNAAIELGRFADDVMNIIVIICF